MARALEILSGVHPVREALRARRRKPVRLHVRSRPRSEVEDLVALARRAGVPVVASDESALAELAGEAVRTQGVVLEAGPLPELELDAVADSVPPEGCLVALDGVEDPQNVGAVVRVAEAAGVSALILTRRHAPPLSPALARASAGAIEHLPVARVSNLSRSLNSLKEKHFWIFGAESGEGEDVFGLAPRVVAGRKVVVLGAEGRGLRPAVQAEVDHRVHIPLAGQIGSLNVASAAAVLLFELRRRQGGTSGG
jgi:23S rRNA (guanosine2251-2'-O)-methyltransferase